MDEVAAATAAAEAAEAAVDAAVAEAESAAAEEETALAGLEREGLRLEVPAGVTGDEADPPTMKVEVAGRSLVVFCPLGAPAGTKFKMAVPAELLKSVRAKIDARRTAARRDAEARAGELRREATRVAAAATERDRAARLLAAATGEGGAIPDDVNFVAVPQFCGRRDGFVYKAGARGVGYYREGVSEAAGDATAPPVGVSAHGRGDYSSRGFYTTARSEYATREEYGG